MRELITILLLLLLFPFYSCQRRGSAQEEAFLNKMESATSTLKSEIEHKKLLLEAELKYDFTISQLLRLKKIQLSHMNIDLTQKEKKAIYDDIEALAVKTGNDSILIAYRAFVFNAMCWNSSDYKQLSDILSRDKAFLVKKNKWDVFGGAYYLGISLNCRRHLNYDLANYYAFKNRRYAKNISAWYGEIAKNMLEGKRYPQAVIYADSAIVATPIVTLEFSPNIEAYGIKSKALSEMGKTKEALALYKMIEEKIEEKKDNFRKIRIRQGMSDTTSYAARDCYYLYNYAMLLKQSGSIDESVRVLEKISFFIKYDDHSNPNSHISTEISKNIPRLLSECYSLLGDSSRFRYYALRADSILIDIKRLEVERAISENSHELSELHLSDIIAHKELKERMANIMQYVMISIIGILLALIAVGWLWWRQRRKRIKSLFEQIMYRHAAWANLQLSVADSVESDLDVKIVLSPEQEDSIPLHYPIIYRKINYIVKNKALFLDPNLELATLSHEVGISRTLLSNVLNRHAGMNFNDWLAEYRVNYLLEQIKMNPDVEISELYLKSGFNSRATFFRHFRNVTGLTPKQYMSRLKYHEDGDKECEYVSKTSA